jgi:hypothetical protein
LTSHTAKQFEHRSTRRGGIGAGVTSTDRTPSRVDSARDGHAEMLRGRLADDRRPLKFAASHGSPTGPAAIPCLTRSKNSCERLDPFRRAGHCRLVLFRSVSDAFCSDYLDVFDAEEAKNRRQVAREVIVRGKRSL